MKTITLPLAEYEDLLHKFVLVEKQRDHLLKVLEAGECGYMTRIAGHGLVRELADSVRRNHQIKPHQLADFLEHQLDMGMPGRILFEELTSGRIGIPSCHPAAPGNPITS